MFRAVGVRVVPVSGGAGDGEAAGVLSWMLPLFVLLPSGVSSLPPASN